MKLCSGRFTGSRFLIRRGRSGAGGRSRRNGFPGGLRATGEQIVIAGQVQTVGRKIQVSLDGLGLGKVNVPLQLNLVPGAVSGRQADLELVDVGGLLLQRRINLQPGCQRRRRELPFGIMNDEVGHLQIGLDGGTACSAHTGRRRCR